MERGIICLLADIIQETQPSKPLAFVFLSVIMSVLLVDFFIAFWQFLHKKTIETVATLTIRMLVIILQYNISYYVLTANESTLEILGGSCSVE